MAQTDPDLASATGVDLVLALCHEIGNFVGAMRLHSHLLDPDMGARDLARTAIDLDDLSSRSSALLMQIRPLLRDDPPGTPACNGAALLEVMRELLLERGGQGTALRFDEVASLPAVVLSSHVLRALISGFAFRAIEACEGRGFVRIGAELRSDAVAFVIEDDAEQPEDLVGWRTAALRGLPLQCAVASHILERFGGRLEVARHSAPGPVTAPGPATTSRPGSAPGLHTPVTHIELIVPLATQD